MISPGPGTYEPKISIHPKGTYFNSKFKNSRACVISPSKTERFRPLSKTLFLGKDFVTNPGPGTYNPKIEISHDGSYFNSKY